MVEVKDLLALLHPLLAVVVVFPLIGIVVNMAWQTRQRRLMLKAGEKTKIPPVVGVEHVKIGRWLTGWVVGITLLAFAYSIFVKDDRGAELWSKNPSKLTLLVLIFAATIGALTLLHRATPPVWRAIFATLTGTGIVFLGCQDGVFRRGFEWYISHYHYGVAASLLMVFSLAILPDIYRDRSNRWRITHIVLNCIALLLFFGQGVTGSRDLLEIPLSWQKPYLFQCDWGARTCPFPKSDVSRFEGLLTANSGSIGH